MVSVRQKKPLGLGHAVLCARDLVGDEPFAVMLADDLIDTDTPCIRQLLDIFEDKRESVIALMEVLPEEVQRYGVIKGQEIEKRLYQIEGTVEKPPAKEAPSKNGNHRALHTSTGDFCNFTKPAAWSKGVRSS